MMEEATQEEAMEDATDAVEDMVEVSLEEGNGPAPAINTPRDVTEVTQETYLERIGDSCKGMVFGFILIFGAVALLAWNEGNVVANHRALDEGDQVAISLPNISAIDPANEGKLVHLVGPLQTLDIVQDDVFGVTPDGSTNGGGNVLKLQRNVEMFQWIEQSSSTTTTNTGGSTTTKTTYTYSEEWMSTVISSSSFKEPNNHENPTSMPYQSTSFVADPITMGAFTLSSTMVNRVIWLTKYTGPFSVSNISDTTLRNRTTLNWSNDGFYIGVNGSNTSSATPAIGDMRINFYVVNPQTVTIVAEQSGNTLSPYIANNGRTVLLMRPGTYSSEAMFQQAQDDTTAVAWVLRFVGFFIMYIGFLLVAQPLSTFADVIPCFGDLVGGAMACILLPVALSLSLFVIALAWVAYRPIVALCILGVIGGMSFVFYHFVVRRRQEETRSEKEDDAETQVES